MNPDNLMVELIRGIVEAQCAGIDAGAQAVELRINPALKALEREFLASQLDPETRMKSSLQLAIMAVLQLLPPISDVSDVPGRPDQDLDVCGRKLRAGS